MNFRDAAKKLAAHGFYVFPLISEGKSPALKDWQEYATRDPEIIHAMWTDPVMETIHPYNIGISTSKFGDQGECLIVLDVDTKKGKKGEEGIIELALDGKELPKTYTQRTPTGGTHLVYRSRVGLGNSVGRIATDIDVRSIGGLLVGAYSEVGGGRYASDGGTVEEAPDWLTACDESSRLPLAEKAAQAQVQCNPEVARDRGLAYLQEAAPVSVEGQGGNHTAYQVACRLKDLGNDVCATLDLLTDHWNDRCEPPWSTEELVGIVNHAYEYGKRGVGAAAPEADFQPVIAPVDESASSPGPVSPLADPVSKFNSEYAFAVVGTGHCILHETVDEKDRPTVRFLEPATFHARHASQTMEFGKGVTAITKVWMNSPRRRTYDGVCFMPGRSPRAGYFNLWRGFAVDPLEGEPNEVESRALANFLDHVRLNICNGSDELYRWVMGYVAHLVQKPWDRPGVALVLRGTKGVGKNAFIDTIGYLLGDAYLLTSKQRYLTGNFNAHLQNLLMFTLDEAFWSGAKDVEGVLKDLITGTHHVIERKGVESFRVDNCLRVVILGNEDWLVPASDDERRYAVLDVGEGRKQDGRFFEQMRLDMEAGGYNLLLRHLLGLDISGVDVKKAPSTNALLDQKLRSLDPIHQWWRNCLHEGEIPGAGDEWPEQVAKDIVRSALKVHWKDCNIRSRLPEPCGLGKILSKVVSVATGQQRTEGRKVNTYRLPPLDEARKQFEKFIGHEVQW